MQMEHVGELERPRTGHPLRHCPIAELERLIEVAFAASHGQPLAHRCERRGDAGFVTQLAGQSKRRFRSFDRLCVLLRPNVRQAKCDQRVKPVPAAQLRHE